MRTWHLTLGIAKSNMGPVRVTIAVGPLPRETERIEVIEKTEYDKLKKEFDKFKQGEQKCES